MAAFTYIARSRDGKKVEGSVNADDRRGALRQIEAMVRQQGYQGYVSLELFNPALWAQDLAEVARLGLERMRTYFAG